MVVDHERVLDLTDRGWGQTACIDGLFPAFGRTLRSQLGPSDDRLGVGRARRLETERAQKLASAAVDDAERMLNGQFGEARYRGSTMETQTAVIDLTVACVTSVKNAIGMELDLTQETLPILDHYAALLDSPRDEIVSLMAPMCGAYFGEVVRRQLEDGQWVTDADDHAKWRLHFERCSLTFNPIGLALEVILGQDVPDWGAHVQTGPKDQLRVEKALQVFGDVRDRDYYTFSLRFEAIEQAYLGLVNNPVGMKPKP
jgi:hypothetical protein